MIVKPLGKKVFVGENKREATTASGIVIQGNDSKGDSKSGTVLAIGPDVTEVKVGDVIYLMWNKSKPVTIDGVQRVIIDEDDIVAVEE